jgi:hypothetical protein
MNDTMTDTTDTTTALILAGDGYQLTIAPEAIARKAEIISAAAAITSVSDNDSSADAQVHSRRLAEMRIEVEKSRKAIKEPVNRIGKLIDQAAKDFTVEIEAEEKRITRLIGDHAVEVTRLKAEKERAERIAFEEARRAREEAERAAEAAANTGRIADIIAAKKAEQERADALAERMAASTEVAETNVAQGVRFAWDFEVDNIAAVYKAAPEFVDLTVRRSDVLAWLKMQELADEDAAAAAALIGIRAFKKPVVSSR